MSFVATVPSGVCGGEANIRILRSGLTRPRLPIPAATGPSNYDRLSRVPVQQSNYDHLAGSTPVGSAPKNYDHLAPRGEANSDGYYEAAAIAGAEAPVYHTTQQAAEPASGRFVMIFRNPHWRAV